MAILTKSNKDPIMPAEPLVKVPTHVPKTQHTSDYALFRVLSGNRPVSKYHVREVAQSFMDNPELIELRPILVNESMEIIDGQHRLRACEMLGIEVPYIVAPGLTIGTAQIMNALQRPWKLIDFANSYAFAGNNHYQRFMKYLDDYAPLQPNTLLTYISGTQNNSGPAKTRFKMGKFTFPVDSTEVDDRLGKLTSFADVGVNFWQHESFAMAFLRILRDVEDYDHERMLANVKKMTDFERKPTIMEQLRELERAYNFRRTDVGVKRFF